MKTDIHASQDAAVADLVRAGQVRIGMFPPHYIKNATTGELKGWGVDLSIGTVRVACSNGPKVGAPWARMTSGASATNSAACLRISAGVAPAHRVSIRALRPMVPRAATPPPRYRAA